MRGDCFLTALSFSGARCSVVGELEGVLDLLPWIGARFLLDSRGEHVGLIYHEFTVEEIEGLKGSDRPTADRGCLSCIRAVKGAEYGCALHPNLVGVDHASQSLTAEGFHDGEAGKSSATLEEIEARSTHPEIKIAADREHTVANGLCFESTEGKAPQESCFFVEVTLLFPKGTRLLVGAGGQDETVEFFQGPPVSDEAVGEPVEKIGVTGRGAIQPKIAGSMN